MKKTTGAMLGLAAAGIAWAVRGVPAALGGKPDPALLRRSPRFRDDKFHNVKKTSTMPDAEGAGVLRDYFFGGGRRKPSGPVPLVGPPPTPMSADGLHITWYGHASSLVEIDGARVLLDPIWSDRCSP